MTFIDLEAELGSVSLEIDPAIFFLTGEFPKALAMVGDRSVENQRYSTVS